MSRYHFLVLGALCMSVHSFDLRKVMTAPSGTSMSSMMMPPFTRTPPDLISLRAEALVDVMPRLDNSSDSLFPM